MSVVDAKSASGQSSYRSERVDDPDRETPSPDPEAHRDDPPSGDGSATSTPVGMLEHVLAFVRLTKPRVIQELLIIAVPPMFVALGGIPDWRQVLTVVLGGYAAAGAANVFNNVYDRDIDATMRRTRRRPIPRAEVGAKPALFFGSVLTVAAVLILGFGGNLLSAGLGVLAIVIYVFLYTMLLKRRTAQNIVWGGIAGCFPPLIGWTVVTNSIDWPPFLMFLIVFFWTPPHTWALAFRYREDYEAAKVPMMPVVRNAVNVTWQMLWYSLAMVAVSVLLWPVAGLGWIYAAVAVLVGVVFMVEAVQLLQRARRGLRDAELKPMRLFIWSNSYLALLFLAMAIDPLIF